MTQYKSGEDQSKGPRFMKQVLCIIFILMSTCLNSYAQKARYPEMDSLIRQLRNTSVNHLDSAIMVTDSIIRISRAENDVLKSFVYGKNMQDFLYRRSSLKEIRKRHRKAEKEYKWLIENREEDNDIVDLNWFGYLSVLANTSSTQGFLDSALLYNELAIEIATRHNDKYNTAIAKQNATIIYYRQGRLEKALAVSLEIKELFYELEKYGAYASVTSNIGSIYTSLGNVEAALQTYKELAAFAQEKELEEHLAGAWGGLARLYYSMKDYQESKHYNLKAIKVYKKLNARQFLAQAYSNLADSYRHYRQIDSANYYYQLSLAIHKDGNVYANQAYVLERMGSMYLQINEVDKGLNYINQGISIVKKVNSPEDELLLYSAKAKALVMKGEPKKALPPLLRSIEIANETEDKSFKADVFEIAHEVYRENRDFEKAYRYLLDYQINNDSIRDENQIRELSKAEFDYNLKVEKERLEQIRKEEELLYQAELARQKIIAYGIGLILLIVSIAAVLVIRSVRLKARLNKQLENSNLLLSEANDALKRLDQFRIRLFANINHDIRTPLTLIQGYISQIKSNKDNYLTRDGEEKLDLLQNNASVLAEMSNDIQDLLLLEESKLKLKYQETPFSAYIKRLVKMFSSLAELSNIGLNYHSETGEEVIVHLDQRYFEKIFYNLISNAFRYTPEGGEIYITTGTTPGGVQVIVKDTGRGIAEADLPHVFKRFYQSPMNEYRSKEGFGIGLAVVHELVELHGGNISVASQEGVGTIFTLELPYNLDKPVTETDTQEQLVDETVPTKPAPGSGVTTRDGEKPVIMVVDDHEEIRQYIKSLLEVPFVVKEASNGKQALKVLRKNHVDLIITDLMMPWLDGFDLIDRLKEQEAYKDIPVMVVSARTGKEDKYRVLDAGVNEFVSKPFDPQELRKRIENILQKNTEAPKQWENIRTNPDTAANIEKGYLIKLNDIILENISNPDLNLEIIAAELSASRSKAIRVIKQLTGKTPLAYVREIRMNYVDTLIRKRAVKNATEAANAVGMKHATHFSKQYKSHFGKSPVFPKAED